MKLDAKSKADFINSVAAGKKIPCPVCGTANESDDKFCVSCGAEIGVSSNPDKIPAFKQKNHSAPFAENKVQYDEPYAAFAQGLPEWSVEPPQVVVRRR